MTDRLPSPPPTLTASSPSPSSSPSSSPSYLIPFGMITALFFLSGFTFAILDVLNRHFQVILGISKAQSGLIQTAVCSAYFIMALPAGLFMRRQGYRRGVLAGLGIAAVGAFLFIPAGTVFLSFWAFLAALFTLACGLTFLEIAANPYVTILGPPASGPWRLNLAQSFNGVGWILGPVVGGLVILGQARSDGSGSAATFSSVLGPFIVLGVAIATIATVFFLRPLPENLDRDDPEPGHDGRTGDAATNHAPLWRQPHFTSGVAVQFLYNAGQQSVNAFALNYILENRFAETSTNAAHDREAAFLISLGLLCFAGGRFVGTGLMRLLSPSRMLAAYGLVNVAIMALVMADIPQVSWAVLLASWFFMSIMYPTIFSLSIRGLGGRTKLASSILVMAILGGAVAPPGMGLLADRSGLAASFIIPLLCFAAVGAYGLGYPLMFRRSSAASARLALVADPA